MAYYNPASILERDLCILVIDSYIDQLDKDTKVKILNTTVGSGIKPLRILKELKNINRLEKLVV